MPISASLQAAVDQELSVYCERRVPQAVRDKVRLVHVWEGNSVTLIEQRPYWEDASVWMDHPVAKFKYPVKEGSWRLYWRDQHRRWHEYKPHLGSKAFFRVLAEVDQDETGIFWG